MGQQQLFLMALMLAVGAFAVVGGLIAANQMQSESKATTLASTGISMVSAAQADQQRSRARGASRTGLDWGYSWDNALERMGSGARVIQGHEAGRGVIKGPGWILKASEPYLFVDSDYGRPVARIKPLGESQLRVGIYADGRGGYLGKQYRSDSETLAGDGPMPSIN